MKEKRNPLQNELRKVRRHIEKKSKHSIKEWKTLSFAVIIFSTLWLSSAIQKGEKNNIIFGVCFFSIALLSIFFFWIWKGNFLYIQKYQPSKFGTINNTTHYVLQAKNISYDSLVFLSYFFEVICIIITFTLLAILSINSKNNFQLKNTLIVIIPCVFCVIIALACRKVRFYTLAKHKKSSTDVVQAYNIQLETSVYPLIVNQKCNFVLEYNCINEAHDCLVEIVAIKTNGQVSDYIIGKSCKIYSAELYKNHEEKTMSSPTKKRIEFSFYFDKDQFIPSIKYLLLDNMQNSIAYEWEIHLSIIIPNQKTIMRQYPVIIAQESKDIS